MIHSARPNIIILAWTLFCFARFWKAEGRTYRQHLWNKKSVGLVGKKDKNKKSHQWSTQQVPRLGRGNGNHLIFSDVQTDDVRKNSDRYRPWLWVDLVDQLIVRNCMKVISQTCFDNQDYRALNHMLLKKIMLRVLKKSPFHDKGNRTYFCFPWPHLSG